MILTKNDLTDPLNVADAKRQLDRALDMPETAGVAREAALAAWAREWGPAALSFAEDHRPEGEEGSGARLTEEESGILSEQVAALNFLSDGLAPGPRAELDAIIDKIEALGF